MDSQRIASGLMHRGAMAFGLLLVVTVPATGQPGRTADLRFGSRAHVARVQDSLERVAVGSPVVRERGRAIIRLATIGISGHTRGGEVPYPGVIAALRRIYPKSGSLERETIVGLLEGQVERTETLAFLSELARSDDMGLQFPICILAVGALTSMGPQGEEVLRQLHASGEGNEIVRKMLDRLAQTGYREPPPEPKPPRPPQAD